jgi:hypothetical protein
MTAFYVSMLVVALLGLVLNVIAGQWWLVGLGVVCAMFWLFCLDA